MREQAIEKPGLTATGSPRTRQPFPEMLPCIIAAAGYRAKNRNQTLHIGFQVSEGDHKGTCVNVHFKPNFKGLLSLSYLCRSLRIPYPLRSPDDLLGRKVMIVVIAGVSDDANPATIQARILRFYPYRGKGGNHPGTVKKPGMKGGLINGSKGTA